MLFGLNAHGGVSVASTGAAGGLSATTATKLSIQRGGGSAHMSLIPYFSTQGGNSTLINLVNMDMVNGKTVKVRFRGAGNGDSLFSFTLLLAPRDTWAMNVSSDGGNGTSFATVTDKSCTLPADLNAAFVTTRLPASFSAARKAEWTREGSVEIITMADIPSSARSPQSPLFQAIFSIDSASPPCGNEAAGAAVLDALMQDPASEAAARQMGLDTPTTGVRATSILINIQDAAISWSTPTTSLTWLDDAGLPARGRLIFSPQTGTAAPDVDLYTNDPLLRSVSGGGAGKLAPIQADLPDLSTPYAGRSPNAIDLPFRQTEQIGGALQVSALSNEFLRDPAIGAVTDWTVAQPMKRYAVAVDHSGAQPALVFNGSPAGPSSHYRPRSNTAPLDNVDLDRDLGRTLWSIRSWDDSGRPTPILEFVTLGQSRSVDLLGNVSVVVFDHLGKSQLKASITAKQPTVFPYDGTSISGWAQIGGYPSEKPLPLTGALYSGARGPIVSGKSTNFGIAVNHEFTK
ncbi:MAG: hypothetical protein ABI212_11860 [Burkholderiaceae bacterium]